MASVSRQNILLANSPIFIVYSGSNPSLYNFIEVKLWVWNGDISAKTELPNFKLTAYKNRAIADSISIEISDYISPFLNPLPNSSFFDNVPSGFGEFVNVYFEIEAYIINGPIIPSETIVSPNLFACLGYGLVNQGAMPKLGLTYTDGLSGIDSSLLTIDSTIIHIDSDGKLIDNKKRISVANLKHFNAALATTTTSSAGVVNRTVTNDFKAICTKG